MQNGWIKLHRKINENSFLMHDDNAYIVFTKLLLLVGREKGQWSGGRRQLAQQLNVKDRTLYQVLIRLKRNHLITIESNQRFSTYTICNWHKYQDNDNHKKEKETTTAQPQRNHSATTAQHSNKKKNKEKEKEDTNILIEKNQDDQAQDRASPETIERIRLKLQSKGILKKTNLEKVTS